ncbi:MAG: tannase/feruloyl esterase family alpha/beta hydrolase [Acidobacteriaceae bacterium]|nr:tannase/feruloyl esterase family alpha/beta hydrolase [Acidobacteriaceae bacterium]
MAATCDSLSSVNLPYTTVTLAHQLPAGGFTPPLGAPPQAARNLPAFCRVAATLKPTADSDIRIEVWMPASRWNGKFVAVGNGGWSGAINYGGMAQMMSHGYATASTDTGHEGGEAKFAMGHPEKLIDFAYRSEHELSVKAKAIVAAFYGEAAQRSYWFGCSSGGKQGLTEAQRYPLDYDGIVAGAPANYWTHLMFGDMWPGEITLTDPARHLSQHQLALLHAGALTACDALDGVRDGIIQDPTRCHFDPESLACKGTEGPDCLTAPQVEAARKIYQGPVNPRTHEQIFPGLEPGSELGWGPVAGGPKPFGIVESYFRYVLFQNPDWDFRTLNFDTDVAEADKLDAKILNATDPNLKDFVSHSGKLFLYHGWNDQLIAPQNTVNYYNSVVQKMGPKINDSVRLFLAPGMNHCGGGDGPFRFDQLSALEEWVEKGVAPERVIASHPSGRTRPLCPYPQVAKYKGSGSTDDAANFVCSAP